MVVRPTGWAMISYSHWGMFEFEPRILMWPRGAKVSIETARLTAQSAGYARVIIDKSDLID